MTPAKYVSYRDYRGFVARGEEAVTLDLFDRALHMHAAAWLTAQLEAGALGTVQSYDGAGFSVGFPHELAVYPRTLDQGTAWRTLAGCVPSPALAKCLADAGWHLRDGHVYDAKGLVRGEAIRVQVSGPRGVTPPKGEQHERAKRWILALRETLADRKNVRPQIDSAIAWLAGGHRRDEANAYRLCANVAMVEKLERSALEPERDLAMCVYHSFSVNAPSLARKYLLATPSDDRFSRALVARFRASTYANWPARYDRTRAAVVRSGLWTSGVIHAIMPAR